MPQDKTIIITVSGGLIQDIENVPPGIVIEVRDFDVNDPDLDSPYFDFREFNGELAEVMLWVGPAPK